MINDWLSIDFFEEDGIWKATIRDDNGNAIITIRRHPPKGHRPPKKSGVVGGAHKPGDEQHEGKNVITPKSPQKLAAEIEAEWLRKNIIERGLDADGSNP